MLNSYIVIPVFTDPFLHPLHKNNKLSFIYVREWDIKEWKLGKTRIISELNPDCTEMCENYDIDFWLMDLIEPDYNRLLKEVEGKRVYFNASNIFSYNKVILKYTLPELYESFSKLYTILKSSDGYYFRGTVPLKKFIKWK